MREFKVLHDTWIGGKPYAKDAVVRLESEDEAKGLVKSGLIAELNSEGEGDADKAKAKPAAKGKAG